MDICYIWQQDKGFRKTRILNKAILEAKNEYIVFADGDCIARKDFLAVHISQSAIRLPASHDDMVTLVHATSHRIARYLEKVGLVQRDMENSYLNLPVDDEFSLLQLQRASVSYRIAMGPQQGQNSPRLVKINSEQRLKRVFNIDITESEKCQKHNVTIIACIIDTVVIQKILAHLDKTYPVSAQATQLPPLRAPPNDFSIQRDFNFGA